LLNKKHKNLQEKCLKLNSELRKKPQEDLYTQAKKLKLLKTNYSGNILRTQKNNINITNNNINNKSRFTENELTLPQIENNNVFQSNEISSNNLNE
jgi:hypothetical protein